MKKFWICLTLLISPPLFASERFSRSQLMMGDVEVTITVSAASVDEKNKVWTTMEQAFAAGSAIEKRVSEWNPESDTSQLNQSGGQPPRVVNDDLLLILLLARDVSDWTGGAFDVTFASPDKTASYRDMVIDEATHQVSWQKPGIKIGVSSTAKGYIVDQMIDVMKKAGFQNVLINAGDIRAIGQDGKKPWTVLVRNEPKQRDCTFSLKDQALSTSGTAARGLHLIDPRIKQPVDTISSVSVLAPTSSLASSLATGLFVLGKPSGLQLLKKSQRVSVLFIDHQGGMAWTGKLQPRCTSR